VSAIKDVRNGAGYNASAKKWKIPPSSFRGYYKAALEIATVDLEEFFHLPPLGGLTRQLLTPEQELALEQHILQRAALDSCLHTLAARQKAQKLAGCEDLPGEKWLLGFLERHPHISARVGQMVSNSRRESFTEEALAQMEKRARETAQKHGITEDWQVVVMDECGESLDKASARVIGAKNARGATMAQGEGEKGEHVTLKVGSFGDGKPTTPMVLFQGVRFSAEEDAEIDELVGDDVIMMKNPKGSCDARSMIAFVKRCVLPHVPQRGNKALMLILDQYWSESFLIIRYHCDLEFLEYCTENNIVVFGGIPHGTHKWQIPDTHFNSPLKKDITLRKLGWYQDHPNERITLARFCLFYRDATFSVLTSATIKKAFVDIGWLPPFSLVEKLGSKTVEKTAPAVAAEGHHPVRELRRQSTPLTNAVVPRIPTLRYVLSADTVLPKDRPATWSADDLYEIVKGTVHLHQKNLAAPAQKQKKRKMEGAAPQFNGAVAVELTAPERMAARVEKQAAWEAAKEEKAEKKAARLAAQRHSCKVSDCSRAYKNWNGLTGHYRKQHPNSPYPQRVYCIPGCSLSPEDEMIGCESKSKCSIEWFHLACVDLEVVPAGGWRCSDCDAPPNPDPQP